MIWIYSILGTCLASFISVLAIRIPQNKPVVIARSKCDSCKQTLAWYHEIPILSYIFLKGKCQFCKEVIAPDIFVIEILGAVVGIECSLQSSYSDLLLFFFVSTIMYCAYTDFLTMSISPICLFPITVFVLVFQFPDWFSLVELIIFSISLIIFYLAEFNKIGFGDVEVMIIMCLMFGLITTLEIILSASTIALLFFAWKYITHKAIPAIPFVPFLFLGLLIRLSYL